MVQGQQDAPSKVKFLRRVSSVVIHAWCWENFITISLSLLLPPPPPPFPLKPPLHPPLMGEQSPTHMNLQRQSLSAKTIPSCKCCTHLMLRRGFVLWICTPHCGQHLRYCRYFTIQVLQTGTCNNTHTLVKDWGNTCNSQQYRNKSICALLAGSLSRISHGCHNDSAFGLNIFYSEEKDWVRHSTRQCPLQHLQSEEENLSTLNIYVKSR